MANLLKTEELKKELNFKYSRNTVLKSSKKLRKFNITAFNDLSREKLIYGETERRLCLYETLKGEKIFIQYPGKESMDRTPPNPLDFRPKLQMTGGEFISDISFGDIWDILDDMAKVQKKNLTFVAALFLRMGYMYDYLKEYKSYEYCDVNIENDHILSRGLMDFEWYLINFSEDVWMTLNDRIGDIRLSETEIFSFEAFIKFVDLLFQNEDCKYYYINTTLRGKGNYDLTNGRIKSSEANLLIINHLEENTKLSELLNAFQRTRGVPKFNKRDYAVVTGDIVINIDAY